MLLLCRKSHGRKASNMVIHEDPLGREGAIVLVISYAPEKLLYTQFKLA